jgi:hypothetical protein
MIKNGHGHYYDNGALAYSVLLSLCVIGLLATSFKSPNEWKWKWKINLHNTLEGFVQNMGNELFSYAITYKWQQSLI